MTSLAFASARGFLGDLTAQKLEHDKEDRFELDAGRSVVYVMWGCASALLYDYSFYSILFPRWWPSYVGGQLHKMNVLKSVSMDSFVLTPLVYFPMFYCLKDTIVAQTHTPPEAISHYGEELIEQNKHSLAFWTPVNVVMFGAVQPAYRVGYTSVMALGYMAILSAVTEGLSKDKSPMRRDTLQRRVSKVV